MTTTPPRRPLAITVGPPTRTATGMRPNPDAVQVQTTHDGYRLTTAKVERIEPKPPCDDAEMRRRKALETLRRSLLSAAKQVAVLEEIEERKETAA